MDINELLGKAVEGRATDIHLSSGHPIMTRVGGELAAFTEESFSAEEIDSMIRSIMTEEQCKQFAAMQDVDFAITAGADTRYRVNAYKTIAGPAAAFRAIPAKILTLEDLEAPPVIKMLAELSRGLVLVTGATGSGKSTTLAAMVHHINTTANKHIITIEDPVEYLHKSDRSLINQREVGRDTASFAGALRSALREDPDVILVGEMRDHETISLALTAAETGQLVLSTLHTNSAVKTLHRIIDAFPAGDKAMVQAMLAGTLEGVIAQVLLNHADGVGKAIGYEVLIGTMAVRNLIREEQVQMIYSMMQTGARYGMQTMDDAIDRLVAGGRITMDEADRARLIIAGAAQTGEASSDEKAGSEKAGDGESKRTRPTVAESYLALLGDRGVAK